MLDSIDLQIAEQRAQGTKLSDIAKNVGFTNNSSVAHRLRRKPDLRAHLQNIQKKLVEHSAQSAADNIVHLIKSYRSNNCTSEKKRLEKTHGWRATERLAESVGVFTGRGESSVVVNILNKGNLAISPDVLQILSGLGIRDEVEVPELGLEESE